jgi:hypothetical protein
MAADTTPPFASADVLVEARRRISTGPVPAWVALCPFDAGFKAKEPSPVTHLLVSRQIHAETGQSHHHSAMRLETLQAVQTQSQWQLQFEPYTQSITLHWIKVRRGDQEFDQTRLEKIRLLQREEGLERFVIHGWCTLLLLLEDVRPGDIVESCYTIETRRRLLPANCTAFFTLPPGAPVGKFHYSLKFNESRPMKWKSAAVALTPTEARESGEVWWSWSGENYEAPGREPNTPDWHMAGPWIQVSDCTDWRIVVLAIAEAWKEDVDDPVLAEIAKEIAGKEPDLLVRVEKAIELVQDGYRHLQVNIEPASQLPASPGFVVRNRYGDSKDLSFLLVRLLHRWGVPARPVLVNTRLRKSLTTMLPMEGLFNHVVVEFTVQNQTRWVDVMLQHQGGGALNRLIPDYGVGLPVDLASDRLVESPRATLQSSRYELKESILLDTTGAPSFVSMVLHTNGAHAEALRQQIEKSGLERVAEERQQFCAERYANAMRVGSLEFRDDRAANEFILAEVFTVDGFLAAHPKRGMCRLRLTDQLLTQTLKLPDKTVRQTPFLLPYPCNIVHTIIIEAPALQPLGVRRRNIETPFVKFSRSHKCLHRFWSMKLTLSTLADAVPPDRIKDHCAAVEDIRESSSWEISLPIGYPHPVRRMDFGSLPPPPRKLTSHASEPLPAPKAAASLPIPPPANRQALPGQNLSANPTAKRRRKHHSQRPKSRKILWLTAAVLVWALVVYLLLHARR